MTTVAEGGTFSSVSEAGSVCVSAAGKVSAASLRSTRRLNTVCPGTGAVGVTIQVVVPIRREPSHRAFENQGAGILGQRLNGKAVEQSFSAFLRQRIAGNGNRLTLCDPDNRVAANAGSIPSAQVEKG
jgi:hypothetical protein